MELKEKCENIKDKSEPVKFDMRCRVTRKFFVKILKSQKINIYFIIKIFLNLISGHPQLSTTNSSYFSQFSPTSFIFHRFIFNELP